MDAKLQAPTTEVSVEDLEQALELTDNEERSEDEQRILEGIVNFGSKDAKQVMTPTDRHQHLQQRRIPGVTCVQPSWHPASAAFPCTRAP